MGGKKDIDIFTTLDKDSRRARVFLRKLLDFIKLFRSGFLSCWAAAGRFQGSRLIADDSVDSITSRERGSDRCHLGQRVHHPPFPVAEILKEAHVNPQEARNLPNFLYGVSKALSFSQSTSSHSRHETQS
jgi:hypothetical protein